jgi:uncharacterized membrane protein YhaH (DUF805 family)
MAFCAKCGTKLDEGAKFCIQCGTPAGGTTEPVQPQIVAQPAPFQQQLNINQPSPEYRQPGQTDLRQQSAYQDQATYNAISASGQNKNPWQYFCGVWKKYAVFSGRAQRAEYWWFVLFNVIGSFVLGFIEGYADLYITDEVGLLSGIYGLVAFLPALAVAVRRMHDCGKSGWYLLIPIYGWIVLPCTAGVPGPNQYGPDPKQTNGQGNI